MIIWWNYLLISLRFSFQCSRKFPKNPPHQPIKTSKGAIKETEDEEKAEFGPNLVMGRRATDVGFWSSTLPLLSKEGIEKGVRSRGDNHYPRSKFYALLRHSPLAVRISTWRRRSHQIVYIPQRSSTARICGNRGRKVRKLSFLQLRVRILESDSWSDWWMTSEVCRSHHASTVLVDPLHSPLAYESRKHGQNLTFDQKSRKLGALRDDPLNPTAEVRPKSKNQRNRHQESDRNL